MMLTSGDLVRLTGVAMNTLDRWATAGLLSPQNEGQGTGRHRTFTLGEAVAVAAGLKYRNEGAGPDRVAGVVKLLATIPLERLEQHLADGESFPVPAMLLGDAARPDCWLPGLMIKPPEDLAPAAAALLRRIDLGKIVADVKAKAEALTKRVRIRKRSKAKK